MDVEVQWSDAFEQGMPLMNAPGDSCLNEYVPELVAAGGAAELSLLQRISRAGRDDALRAAMIAQAYDRVWERLHCGSWKTVARIWRQAFAYASVLKALHLSKQEQYVDSLRILDMVITSPHNS